LTQSKPRLSDTPKTTRRFFNYCQILKNFCPNVWRPIDGETQKENEMVAKLTFLQEIIFGRQLLISQRGKGTFYATSKIMKYPAKVNFNEQNDGDRNNKIFISSLLNDKHK
jgi:hypothetical protein